MYCRKNIHTTIMTDITIPEVATIIVQIHKDKTKTDPIHTIINLYRRPRKNKQLTKDIQTAIDSIHAKHPRTSITIQGDINIDLLQLTPQHPLTELMNENVLRTTIVTPTRYDPQHNSATLLDVMLTTLITNDIISGTLSPPISDHIPTYAIINTTVAREPPNTTPTLSNGQYEKQREAIIANTKHRITEALASSDEHATTDTQLLKIQQAIGQALTSFEIKPKRPRKPWCDPKLARMISKQHRLHKIRINNPTPENIARHARYRNQKNKAVKKAKRTYLAEKLTASQKDPKKQAAVLKSVIPANKRSRSSPTAIQYEGKTHTEPKAIANALNDFFITIGDKTSKTISSPKTKSKKKSKKKPKKPPKAPVQPLPQQQSLRHVPHKHPTFRIRRTTIDIVTKTLSKLNPNKASDIYKIKPAILKDLAPFLAPILTTLFNKAIDEHEYPDSLKLTKVIELYKAKDRTLPANYRPISLLPIIAKVLDKIINDQIMHHLTSNNIISRTQYAFRPNASTTMALQTILNKIIRSKNNKLATLAIYVDLSKAYDTVSHAKLIYKLQHDFNFDKDTIAFIASYFKNRQQTTHTQHAQSDTQTITDGIPQGSTLSTTFFLLYINDILKTVSESDVYTYADDTTLIISANSLEELERIAQSELTSLIGFFHTNNLVPNPTKTNYSIFYPTTSRKAKQAEDHPPIQLTIGKTTLEQNSNAKLLGLYVAESLKHTATITNIVRKLQPIAQSFRYATKLLPQKQMLDLYYSNVYPHLMGSITIWGTTNSRKTYMQPLIRMQKRFVRLIRNLPRRTHTKPIMNELKILDLPNLYKLRVCMEIHPFIHPKKADINRPEHNHQYEKAEVVHDHRTRQASQNNLYIVGQAAPNKQHADQEHYTKKYAKLWNTLPAEIRNIKSKKTFKSKLTGLLLDKQASS